MSFEMEMLIRDSSARFRASLKPQSRHRGAGASIRPAVYKALELGRAALSKSPRKWGWLAFLAALLLLLLLSLCRLALSSELLLLSHLLLPSELLLLSHLLLPS